MELGLETPEMISGYNTEKLIFITSLDTLLAFETSTNKLSNIPGKRQIQKDKYALLCFRLLNFFGKY